MIKNSRKIITLNTRKSRNSELVKLQMPNLIK